jgi:hypothetical protein
MMVLLSACWADHGRPSIEPPRDAGGRPRPPDAGIEPPLERDGGGPIAADAGRPPATGGWRLVPTEAHLRGTDDTHLAGEHAVFQVYTYPEHVCEQPGPVEVERLDARRFRILAYHWRVPGEPGAEPCPAITDRYERTIVVGELLEAGTYEIVDAGGRPVETLVVADAWSARWRHVPRGGPCEHTLECIHGTYCLRAEEWGPRTCVVPCTHVRPGAITPVSESLAPPDVGCPIGERCATVTDPFVPRCVENDRHGCDVDADCGAVGECREEGLWHACRFRGGLTRGTGAPCTGDADCAVGQHCTEDDEGTTSCEVLCALSIHPCPDFSTCRPSPGRVRWTCVSG